MNAQLITNLSDSDYRALPRISNSDLNKFDEYLFGKEFPFIKPSNALEFGTAIHTAILEPKKPLILKSDIDLYLFAEMVRNARKHPYIKWATRFGKKEVTIIWQDDNTQLPCKARLDILKGKRLCIDIKTTSATTEAEFVHSIQQFGYNTQAFFYSEAVKQLYGYYPRFLFIGISKKKPERIFKVDFTFNNLVKEGENKVKKLMEKWKVFAWTPERNYQRFKPSGWDYSQLQHWEHLLPKFTEKEMEVYT